MLYIQTCLTLIIIYLTKTAVLLLNPEADTEKYKPETVSRLINAAEFDIVNSEVIIYSKKNAVCSKRWRSIFL